MHHSQISNVKNINRIHLGFHELDAWYWSPYPEQIIDKLEDRQLYICEFCLKYYQS